MTLYGIILAAGLSSRMGQLKALLPLGTESVLSCCIRLLLDGGAKEVFVVTGHRHEDVTQEAVKHGANVVHNHNFEQGMFSSVKAGVKALPDDATGFFMLPVDIPLVRSATLRALTLAFSRTDVPVLYPAFMKTRGHPPIVHASLIPEILAHDGTGGLRTVLERHNDKALDKAVPDIGILRDMDTPEDYKLGKFLLEHKNIPMPEEFEALWNLAETPAETRRHCKAVAKAASVLAQALNDVRQAAGAPLLDIETVYAAGMMHDIAKGRRQHESTGGSLLAGYGYTAIAEIVASHRDTAITDAAPLTEREMVFLADKFIKGTSIVHIEQRYGERLRQWIHDAEAMAAIKGRLARARALVTRYETEAQVHLPDLLYDKMLVTGGQAC